MRIPIKYCREIKGSGSWQYYVIEPAPALPVPAGYEMHFPLIYAVVQNNYIQTKRGNENWPPYLYMFEATDKDRHHPQARYRFTEEEMFCAYGRAEDPNFDRKLNRRIRLLCNGAGSLVNVQMMAHKNGSNVAAVPRWFLSPDNDKWLYSLRYNPVTNVGEKHRRITRSISVREVYRTQDLSAIWAVQDQLAGLLDKLDHVRSLCIKPDEGSLAKHLALDSIANMPPEVTAEDSELLSRLERSAEEIEIVCNMAVTAYKEDRVSALSKEIHDLIGINIEAGSGQLV